MFRISTALVSRFLKNKDSNLWCKFNNNNRNVIINTASIYVHKKVHDRFLSLYNTKRNITKALEILDDGYKRHNRVHAYAIKNILEQSDDDLIKTNCGVLLLRCCGTLLVDQSTENRQSLCEQVWKKLKELNALNVSHYNEYIRTCTQNNVYLNYKDILQEMKCEPNEDTYKLLLRCVSEFGDTEKALMILSLMKEKQIVADEHVFASLVLAHAIKGGLNEVRPVLKTMQTAHVPLSSVISNSIIRGLVLHNNEQDFLEALKQFLSYVEEVDLIHLMLVLGQTGHHHWFDKVLAAIGPIQMSKQILEEFNLMCIRLIHLGKADVAMKYYKKFVEPTSVLEGGNYAFFLLVEMLSNGTHAAKIVETINNLKHEGLNLVALEKLTFVALKKRLFDVAWELLMNMPNLRPHYFWPFLLQSSKQGEVGVFKMLEKMIELDVRPDVDTLEYYCFHLCDTSKPKQLLSRLQYLGLSLREILTPLLGYLLRQNNIEAVCHLCQSHSVEISSDRLLQPLIKAWVATKDLSVVKILKKLSANTNDFTGQFLIKLVRLCKSSEDNKHYLQLIQAVKNSNLNISLTAAEVIVNRFKQSKTIIFVDQIEVLINKLSHKTITSNNIPHPRQMNITELENHLVELETKEMETRGVLRRLITEYCRIGNYKRAFELRDKVLTNGYEESPGMKTSLMHAYVLDDNVDDALKMYTSIKSQHRNFVIDEFKIIDLATALVQNRKIDKALTILQDEASSRKIQGGSQLIRNCWKLIGSGNDEEETQRLFDVLVKEGYCVPNNIVLGPLVKIHLRNGNLEKAVSVFKEYVGKYNCTPLQLELLSALVQNEKLELLQETLNNCAQVHGYEATVIPAIAAFAQNGLHNPLRKFLLEMKGINKRELEKRCERWINENMIYPLETLAQAARSLPLSIIDKDVIHYSIMKLHSINNDCEAAITFYRELLESDNKVSKRTTDELLRLIQRCKYKVPKELCQ